MKLKYKMIISAVILLAIITSITYFILPRSSEPNNKYEGYANVTFLINGTESINFYCEIADSPEEREKGLMFRENLSENSGMLFVYDEAKNVCFWMKNTLIPLDIIFIDENNSVINVDEAIIQLNVSDNELIRYCGDSSAKFVVEINKGLSKEFNIKKGTIVDTKYI